MASSVQEFRDRARKTVTLPSGLTVEIRKVWLIDFFDLGELPLPSAPAEEGEKLDLAQTILNQREADKYAARAIVKGAVNPLFWGSEEEAAGEDKLCIKELSYEDFQALAVAILTFSSMGKEVKAEADTFRPDAVGKNGVRPGGEVRAAADGDTQDGAGGVLSQSSGDLSGDREKEKKT